MFDGVLQWLRRKRWNYYAAFGQNDEIISPGKAAENDIVDAIADKVAKQASLFVPRLIKSGDSGEDVRDTKLSRLLAERPCPEYSTADFLYKMVSDLYRTHNAIAVIKWSRDYTEVEAIQPVTVSSLRIFEKDSVQFARFVWQYDNVEYTVPLSQVIHLKGRLNSGRFVGTSPDRILGKALGLFDTVCKSIAKIAQNSGMIRGFLKARQLRDEIDIQKDVDNFNKTFLGADNSGGVAAIDPRYDWQEVNQKSVPMPTGAVEFFKQSVLRYYGVSEGVLLGTASEAEMGNFYNGVIAPLALQMSMEFTYKLLSPRERARGNRIDFKTARLEYASLQTRIEIAKESLDRGALTVNEYRSLIGYPPVEDGDVRLVSLNYVRADKQNEYQVGEKAANTPKEPVGGGEDE